MVNIKIAAVVGWLYITILYKVYHSVTLKTRSILFVLRVTE